MNAIINADFNGLNVSFRKDAYINATAIAKQFGKRPVDYLKTEQTQRYIAALSANLSKVKKITLKEIQLVIVKKGGNVAESGTWLHPKLAIDFARWLSPEFAVWCDEQIEKILGSTPSDKINEYEKQQIKDAVNKRHRRTEETHQAIYTKLHQFIGVNSYHEIPASRFQDALQFIGSTADTPSRPKDYVTVHLPKGRNEWLVTTDEYGGYQIMKTSNAPYGSVLIGNDSMVRLAYALHYTQRMRLLLEHMRPVLTHLGSRHAGEALDLINTGATFNGLASFLSKNYRLMDNPQAIRNVEDVLMRTM